MTNPSDFQKLGAPEGPSDKATVWSPEGGVAVEIPVPIPGPPGPPAVMIIGTVVSSVNAAAELRPEGTPGVWYLDLSLPLGEPGRRGDPGLPARFEKVVVTTLPTGSQASGSITGVAPNYTLNLSIPEGPRGQQGVPGPDNFDIWIRQPENGGKDWDDFWESLKGDPGKNIELGVSATHIQWRVVGDTNWTDLVALADLKGEKGDKGDGLKIDAVDLEANKGDYDTELEGFTLLTEDTGKLFIKKTDSSGDWFPGVSFKGKDGTDGKTPEFRMDGQKLQWKYVTDTVWIDLITFPEEGSGGIESIQPGTSNVSIDNTDPKNPKISVTESTGPGGSTDVMPGRDILVDKTDPAKPVVSTIIPISKKGPPGKHRYWRWDFPSTVNPNSTNFQVNKIRLTDAAGSDISTAGLPITASKDITTGRATNAFTDGASSSNWTTGEAAPAWVYVDFGANPVEPTGSYIVRRTVAPANMPDKAIVSFSDNAIDWIEAGTFDLVYGSDARTQDLVLGNTDVPAFPGFAPSDGHYYAMRNGDWDQIMMGAHAAQFQTTTPREVDPNELYVVETQEARIIPDVNWVPGPVTGYTVTTSKFLRVTISLNLFASSSNGVIYGAVMVNGDPTIANCVFHIESRLSAFQVTTMIFPVNAGDVVSVQIQGDVGFAVNGASVIQYERFY